MIISVGYVIAFIVAIAAVSIIKKNDNKINIVNEMFNSYILVICFDAACALIMTWINIPVNLMSIMIFNIVFSSLIYIYVKKIGRKQEFFISYEDIFFTALIFAVVAAIAWHIFDGFTIGYNSGDSSTHFSFAMGIIRNESVSAMYFDAFYNAMIIETLAPVLKISRYYIGLEIADTLILFVLTEMIYFTLSRGKSTKKEKVLSFIFSIMCLFGYPLYGYMVGGFLYLTCALMLVCYILYYLKQYLDFETNRKWALFNIIIGLFSLAFTYLIFVPFVFTGIIFTIFVYHIRGEEKERRIHIIKIFVAMAVVVAGVMCAVIAMYLYAHGEHVGVGNAIRFFTVALKQNGFMYSRVYSDFLIFLPIVIITIFDSIKLSEKVFYLFHLVFIIEVLMFFAMALIGVVSGYYYYKLYFILWILCWLSVGDFATSDRYDGIVRGACIFTIIFICITSFFHIEDRIYIRQGSLAHHEGFTEETKIYAINYNFLTKEYNTWWLTEDDIKAIEYAVDDNPSRSCALILEYDVSDNRKIMISRWYSSLTGNYSWGMTDLDYDEFVDTVKNNGYEMLALHKDSDYVKKHADWFEHLEVLFENDSVKMVSTDGL